MSGKKPTLLIVGGGFAGVALAQKAAPVADVVLVNPNTFFEITWATVRGILNQDVAQKSAIEYKSIPGVGRVVQAAVTRLAPKEAHLSNGEVIPFDYCAICSGSTYSDAFKTTTATTKEARLAELKAIADDIRAAKSIVVVGGGPAGVEAAAEIVEAYAGKGLTLVHPHPALLNGMPKKASAYAKAALEKHGVKLVLGARVESKPEGRGPATLALSNGTSLSADLVLWCVGAKPNTAFMAPDLAAHVNEKGAVKVLPTLQLEGQPHIFALGDCNDVQETKKGYLAQKQAELAARSIGALIKAGGKGAPKLEAWKPNMGMDMMIVSLGPKDGVCNMNSTVCTGCMPTNMKSKTLFVDQTRSGLKVK